jgi:hypothetical protein
MKSGDILVVAEKSIKKSKKGIDVVRDACYKRGPF